MMDANIANNFKQQQCQTYFYSDVIETRRVRIKYLSDMIDDI